MEQSELEEIMRLIDLSA